MAAVITGREMIDRKRVTFGGLMEAESGRM